MQPFPDDSTMLDMATSGGARPACARSQLLERTVAASAQPTDRLINQLGVAACIRRRFMRRPSHSISALLQSAEAAAWTRTILMSALRSTTSRALYHITRPLCRGRAAISAVPCYHREGRSDRTIPTSAPCSTTSRDSIAATGPLCRGRAALSALPCDPRKSARAEIIPDVAISLNNLAELYRTQGRYAEAEPLYQRSLAI